MLDGLVIIVDDDDAVRDSLEALLQSAGLPTLSFSTGGEFLSADGYAGRCCVLLDYRLPDVSGLEVLNRLSVDRPLLPVIFISGHADASAQKLALGSGAIAALQKPLQDDVLLDTIMRALAV